MSNITADCSHPPPVIVLPTAKNVVLTEGHFGIFNKGPKFVPSKFFVDCQEFLNDVLKWKNTMRWGFYHKFCKTEQNPLTSEEPLIDFYPVESTLLKGIPSKYMAPSDKSHALELFLECVTNEIKDEIEPKSIGDNLTTTERKALNEMKKWDTNIIRPYDKGKGFVIDSRENYRNRMYKELNDTSTFEKMEGTDEIDIVKNINDKIKKWSEIALVDGNISSKISNWMVNEKAKAGKIHQLYKAHKPEKIILVELFNQFVELPLKILPSGLNSIFLRLPRNVNIALKTLTTS